MKIDCLVAEIGSTTTVVNAFNLFDEVKFLGRGMHQTTVDTDVNIGLENAILDLKKQLNVNELTYKELFASSSAAGGLKITVHGLVYEMTAKAAKEAALNAGGNIHLITANRLEPYHIDQIKKISPNMIIIAGGTNYGEKEVSYQNLLDLKDLNIPIIYTGNIANHERIKALHCEHIEIVDNVYPRVDDFNILPLREKIYDTFEKHIIHAKGMTHIFDLVNGKIIPTPGAVMDTTMLLDEMYDGVMTIDVGGATTDIHSVCDPKPEFQKFLEGEPRQKRTVEGDLGVYVNRKLVYGHMKKDELEKILHMKENEVQELMEIEPFIPTSEKGKLMTSALLKTCISEAFDRHVGDLKRVFTTNGLKVIPDGKDLSNVKAIFITGGALIFDPKSKTYIQSYLKKQTTKLIPSIETKIYMDHEYIFASLGVLSRVYKEQAKILLKQTMREV
jgi:uncharacterized protein (TIGR01319 family)